MSVQPSAPEPGKRPAMTMHSLMKMLADGEKITMLTAYDATFAAVADLAGVEIILVGDSLGMTVYGMPDTTEVSLEMMIAHAKAVKKGLKLFSVRIIEKSV
jgi:3-methyl-2-oxobutanoate hydroxymethyltransferase